MESDATTELLRRLDKLNANLEALTAFLSRLLPAANDPRNKTQQYATSRLETPLTRTPTEDAP